MMMYANDNRGMFPVAYNSMGPAYIEKISVSDGNLEKWPGNPFSGSGNAFVRSTFGLISRPGRTFSKVDPPSYTKGIGTFFCPTDERSADALRNVWDNTTTPEHGYFYMADPVDVSSGGVVTPKKSSSTNMRFNNIGFAYGVSKFERISGRSQPANHYITVTDQMIYGGTGTAVLPHIRRKGTGFTGGGNALCADGHVDFIPVSKWQEASGAGNRWRPVLSINGD
jgi:hypothetical protein